MSTTKNNEIEYILHGIYNRIGIDKPSSHDAILSFCIADVDETADPVDWHSGDVEIAFRRFIEQVAQA